MPSESPELWTLVHALRQQALSAPDVAELSVPEREARGFAHVLMHLPIGIEPEESLAGDFGARFATKRELENLALTIKPPPAQETSVVTPSPLQLMTERFYCRAGYTTAHTCADYERIVRFGLRDFAGEVEAGFARAIGSRAGTLKGMQTSLQAVQAWSRRYAQLAGEAASAATDERERSRLQAMAEACERVPWEPARTFHEAVQAVWLVHVAIGFSELSGSSLSLGRADQYLLPFYVADLAAGVPESDLRQSLHDLWLKLNRFGDPACALNLGGLNESGQDLYNPLSALMVDVTRELRLPSPILAARVHDALPEHVWDDLLDERLFSMGQPTFYGEIPCREAIVRRGVPEDETWRFAANSCMGLVMPGEEISDMWGAVVNLLLPLELAINGGTPFVGDLPIELRTPPADTYATFDELYAQMERYLDELAAWLIEANRRATESFGASRPNSFLSALTRDCVMKGLDRAAGGARYHCVIVEGFGWANLADALCVVKRLVFEEGVLSASELVAAAREDFPDAELRARICACPRYGNGDPDADRMAVRVTDSFARAVSRHSHESIYYLPSYHTLNGHVFAGSLLPASLDGRGAGEPLGKNAGPVPGRNTEGLTGTLLSASAVDQRALSGGQAIDISVDPQTLRTPEGREKFRALLTTYFSRGGLQVQVNGLNADRLREAMKEPETGRDLVVKIGGYSACFVGLSLALQEEMVERFDTGL